VAERCRRDVEEFFERDDVSRILPGKQQTVTRQKLKKQKRFLNDTLANLYEKFKAENERHNYNKLHSALSTAAILGHDEAIASRSRNVSV